MKKELKEYIKTNKLSDDDILKLLQSPPPPEEETDIQDEADESEDAADSEEQQHAEGTSAQQETPKPPKAPSPPDLTKMINDAIAAAFKAERDAQLMPAQKPIAYNPPKVKRSEPKPRTNTQTDAVVDSNGQLIW